jgi:hypothetical protein
MKKPQEVAVAAENTLRLWRLYSEAVDLAPERKEELYAVAQKAQRIYECLYHLWQLLGGTSNIRSIFERFAEWQGEINALCSESEEIFKERRKENERNY